MTGNTTASELSVNKDEWPESQKYEILFWKERWPYRDWSMPELQKLRHGDATWFLTNLGFAKKGDLAFEGFEGDVLEVGCGPLGFFETTQNVNVTAIDSLMAAYASEISYSTLGTRGSATYVDKGLDDVTDKYRFVVCSNVLDHTADWMEFLEALVARVRPDGELLLVTDTRSKPSIGHTQVFTPLHLKRAIQWLGLKRFEHFRVVEKKNNHCDFQVFIRVGFEKP